MNDQFLIIVYSSLAGILLGILIGVALGFLIWGDRDGQ